jgi:hypothetical protein
VVADEVGAVVVQSYGSRRLVAHTGRLLEKHGDLAQWATGAEALVIADEASQALPKPPLRISPLPRLVVGAAATAAVLIWQWSPVLYVIAFAGTLASLTDLREEREVRPPLMALRALRANRTEQPPVETHVRIAARAGSRPVIARARKLLQHADLSDDDRRRAGTLLDQAEECLAPSSARPHAVARSWLPAVAGGVAVLAAWG